MDGNSGDNSRYFSFVRIMYNGVAGLCVFYVIISIFLQKKYVSAYIGCLSAHSTSYCLVALYLYVVLALWIVPVYFMHFNHAGFLRMRVCTWLLIKTLKFFL